MEEIQTERLIEARIRNIPYYLDVDERFGKTRDDVNNMFALRGLKDLLLSLPEDNLTDRYKWFIKLLTGRRIIAYNSKSFIRKISEYEKRSKKKSEKGIE